MNVFNPITSSTLLHASLNLILTYIYINYVCVYVRPYMLSMQTLYTLQYNTNIVIIMNKTDCND